jgi:Arc/MetJ-type ribon-helix-helix transcriptional regulator
MSRNQLNIRVSDELESLIDKKRIELASTMKIIPTRSDVVRYALENYLGITMAETDRDRRTSDQLKKGAKERSSN